MKVLKFDPLSPNCSWISKRQNQAIKDWKIQKELLVIMCAGCNSIIHHSKARSFKKQLEIKELRNIKTIMMRDRIVFDCNKCGKQIGEVNHDSSYFKIHQFHVLVSHFQWNQRNKQGQSKRQIPFGFLSGLKIKRLQELICELLYMKCVRYQMKMYQIHTKIKHFKGAFTKFIQLVNVLKQEQEQFTNKKQQKSMDIEFMSASNHFESKNSSKRFTGRKVNNINSNSNKMISADCELTPSTFMNTVSGRRSLQHSKLTVIRQAKE